MGLPPCPLFHNADDREIYHSSLLIESTTKIILDLFLYIRVVSKAAHVRKYLLLPTDFSLGGGELTPTLKVLLIRQRQIQIQTQRQTQIKIQIHIQLQ